MNGGTIRHVIMRLFLHNGGWKILALFLALIVYFTIRGEISNVRVLTVPVTAEYNGVENGVVIESIEPRAVQITLRGSYSEVNQMALSELRCLVAPGHDGHADAVQVELSRSHIRGLMRNVRLTQIEPASVTVRFDRPMSVALPIATPELEGKARGGVQLTFTPTNALVKGSARMLSGLDLSTVKVQTAPINVDGRAQSFTTRVKLYPPGDALTAQVTPAELLVTVGITVEQKTVSFETMPVRIPATLAERWTTDTPFVTLAVSGRGEVVSALRAEDFIIIPKPTGALDGITNTVPLTVLIPYGVALDNVTASPASIRLIAFPQPAVSIIDDDATPVAPVAPVAPTTKQEL